MLYTVLHNSMSPLAIYASKTENNSNGVFVLNFLNSGHIPFCQAWAIYGIAIIEVRQHQRFTKYFSLSNIQKFFATINQFDIHKSSFK
ncbi:hypothetical protein HHI36_021449 [Cryptolaemus montrouzieri]|uniref:Uncharacterized protein n=1 Tax=Cryptolaemus montrouzieri TaxID=559131 RepID=A0ABD2MWZ1_9CUCU